MIKKIAIYVVAIVIIMIGTAISAIHAFLRTRQLSFPIVAHLTLSLSFTYIVASLYADNMVYITIVVTLYNAFFIASLLAATNCGERERLPSIIIPLSCVFFFIRPEYTPLIRHLQIAYLAIRVGIRFAAFVRLHKHYWYWINPPPPSDVSTV